MNILIDTHILLWHMMDDPRLKEKYKEAIEDGTNNIFVSKASLWEITIKVSIGKLKLTKPVSEWGNYFIRESLRELDFSYRDLDVLLTLPFHHNDPFDRLIISQGIAQDLTMISDDPSFKKYPVRLLKK